MSPPPVDDTVGIGGMLVFDIAGGIVVPVPIIVGIIVGIVTGGVVIDGVGSGAVFVIVGVGSVPGAVVMTGGVVTVLVAVLAAPPTPWSTISGSFESEEQAPSANALSTMSPRYEPRRLGRAAPRAEESRAREAGVRSRSMVTLCSWDEGSLAGSNDARLGDEWCPPMP